MAGVIRIPAECGAHGHGVAAGGGQAFAEFRLRLAAHRVKGARPVTEPTVAGAVNKQRGGEAEFLAGADVFGVNAGDVGPVGVGGEGAPFGEEMYVGFGPQHLEAVRVALDKVVGAETKIDGVDFADDGVIGNADGRDADILAGIAAGKRPVVDEGDLEALAGGGDGGGAAGNASANDDQIEIAGAGRGVRFAKLGATPGAKFGQVIGRHKRRIGGEEEGVAPAIKTGQVMERHLDIRAGDVDCAAVLPQPALSDSAKDGSQRNAANTNGEGAGVV